MPCIGLNVVACGYAGLEGSKVIYNDNTCHNRLLQRYRRSYFGVFEEETAISAENIAVSKELQEILFPAKEYVLAGEGGVLAALWELLKNAGCGAVIETAKIPVLQETVELCESFGLDPLRLLAGGCAVCLVEDGDYFCKRCISAGFPADIIGRTKKGVAVECIGKPGTEYLRRPQKDEIYRLLEDCRLQAEVRKKRTCNPY